MCLCYREKIAYNQRWRNKIGIGSPPSPVRQLSIQLPNFTMGAFDLVVGEHTLMPSVIEG